MVTTKQKANLESMSEILEYPDGQYMEKVQLIDNLPEDFLHFTKTHTLEELQECYVKTFELDPIQALYAGVHIFGEDAFKRGTFMARLQEAYKTHDITCTGDLPDFIPYILRLAHKIKDETRKKDLISECITSPLQSMIDIFKDDSNPYKSLLTAVKRQAELSLPVKEEGNNA